MLRSLFGRNKKKPSGVEPADDSIRAAGVGDIVFIPGFWETGDDAYLIVEEINTLKSAYGESREIVCVDGERHASVEWTDDGGLHISVTAQERPLGLSAVGLDYDTLVEWDEHKSIENRIECEGQIYFYRNSYEVLHFKADSEEADGGFWIWEFVRDDEEGVLTVVKWEGLAFEVYLYVNVSPHLVTVYKK